MNYNQMNSEQLWNLLRITDGNIRAQSVLIEALKKKRELIIQTFIDGQGYNPDNLCTIKPKTQAKEA